MFLDFFQDTVDVSKEFFVGESEDTKSVLLQPFRSFRIARLLVRQLVIVPIQFDDELVRNAGEVYDIISYDMLSFEGHSQAICFQILPQ